MLIYLVVLSQTMPESLFNRGWSGTNGPVEHTDWYEWHQVYKSPNASVRERLTLIGRHLHEALGRAGPAPRIISVCAGQGREVLPAVAAHPRALSVEVHLIENDFRNAECASARAAEWGLPGVRVHVADAGVSASYSLIGRAHCVVLAGVFSNISDDDISRTIAYLPRLGMPGGTVVWTHHGGVTGLSGIQSWFEEAGYQPTALNYLPDTTVVGCHRLRRTPPRNVHAHGRLFTFVGRSNL